MKALEMLGFLTLAVRECKQGKQAWKHTDEVGVAMMVVAIARLVLLLVMKVMMIQMIMRIMGMNHGLNR